MNDDISQADKDATIDRMAEAALVIKAVLDNEADPVCRSALVTEVLAAWLGQFEDEQQPYMLAHMTGTALSMLGHAARTIVQGPGGNTEVCHGENEVTVTDKQHLEHSPNSNAMRSEANKAALDLVIDKARSLKLHGVIILSPVCDGCGGLHDFAMVTDMGYGQGGDVARLLRDFAETAEARDGEPVVQPPSGAQH